MANVLYMLLSLAIFTSAQDIQLTKEIQTTTGPIKGQVSLLYGQKEYLGIPYAEPPLGELRFANPVPITPWTSTYKATSRGHSCPQLDVVSKIFLGNEDCLLLDVYVPEIPSSKTPLPVFVWIYGGGWVLGDKFEFGLYGPDKMMENRDMIVVSINYRLGAAGFLAMDELKKEMNSTGNQALLDQIMALKWINDNIAAFGGDPTKITIGGESAGAFSVCWHLASPTSKGLFSAAIMQSGTCDKHEFFRDYDKAVSFSKAFSLANGCNGTDVEMLACMRGVPISRLISMDLDLSAYQDTFFIPPLYPFMPWAATIDKEVLTDTPLVMISDGKWNKVPLLIGTNQNEGNLFDFFLPKNWEHVFHFLLEHFFPDPSEFKAITEFYNISATDKDIKSKVGQLTTDYFFTCSTRRALRAIRKQEGVAYQYQFTYHSGLVELLLGDAHGLELPFVWGHTLADGGFLPSDFEMSKKFRHYWKNWIRIHEPNGADSNTTRFPTWPVYDADGSYLELDTPSTQRQNLRPEACDFWRQFH